MLKSLSTSFALVSLGAALATGCVDARGAYDDYGKRVVDADTRDIDAPLVSSLPNVDGDWLLAVHPVNIPTTLKYRTMFDITPVTANTGTLDISAQPMALADDSAVGDPFIANDVQVRADATFDAPFVGTLPGAANPISGSDVPVDAVLSGELRTDNFVCGTLTGTAGPLTLDGSTWAAVRVDGGTLPTPITSCADQPQ